MSNSFGRFFRITTWGESHGTALGAVIDGCPAGLSIEDDDIREQLDRDVPDLDLGTPRGEINRFQILSGVFEGKTLGTPISIVVWNNDARPRSYTGGRDTLRPGHADFTWHARFGHTDWRGGARASGRECIARLAAGGVARKLAASVGVRLSGKVVELAGMPVSDEVSFASAKARAMKVGSSGDSTGGVIEVIIEGLPPGVGSPVFGKLQSDLAGAFLSIGGVKGLETGLGFEAARMTGSQHNDPFTFDADGRVVSIGNRCGGLLGGISTGEQIVFRLAVKPTPTIQFPQDTVNVVEGKLVRMEYAGRFDANYAPRVVPIAEAMAAFVVVDHLIGSGLLHPARHIG